MPKTTTKVDENAPSKKMTASEMKAWYEENKDKINFAKADEALHNLRDINKNTKYNTISNYSKETVKNYIQNITNNEANLRNLSRYLFYRSQIYYRLCKYYANQADLSLRTIVPNYSLTEENDKEAMLQSYEETAKIIEEMNLQYEFFKAYITCMREDVSYGCAYYTEGEGMFILPLNPDYCKISGIYPDSSYAYAMDMTFFRKNADLLEYWGSPFKEMYSEFEKTGNKWVQMPPEYSVCLKFRSEDWETIAPPMLPIFLNLISLLDLSDLQAVQEEANIYKLIWLEMKTLGEDVDDWSVDPSIMIQYFQRMVDEALPDYISAAIVPGELHEISFPDDATSDVTKVEKATKEILNTAGGAQILNLNSASNSVSFKYGVQMDSEFALSSLIPQTQAIVNRLLGFYCSNPCKVKFFEVSIYQKEEFRKSILESCQNGLPNKLLLNSINGISEKDTMAMNFFEEDVLGITDKLKPFQTSYTQSGKDSGGQTKSDDELSDEGLKSRDGNKDTDYK